MQVELNHQPSSSTDFSMIELTDRKQRTDRLLIWGMKPAAPFNRFLHYSHLD
jgi:hypothetical protein